MRSRFLPYATTPGRLLAQLISDITVAVWTTLWMLVGLAVHDAISIIGEADEHP
ncbi:transmembrane protein [Mycobacterium tuberculosis]|uniref:Transmembrane protein n=1 Tax=Mycobacterium tuberculosis TaxID=1773 RepID=A0A654TTG5_MYCTX|nr:transmembrane protein [Mycobacterium tuberculosis]CFR62715.1 transmembrane protein [Mycobacterium tuberculosis]CFS30766.1 transmembrane protein [Mycobacterium tuberculosis]CKN43098.1 transmembrane protein [Mycobacterium tuberculosis]COU43726.1 transmembrane protein [Mycobacterium tuberculosis]